ncbi:hypothetical protein CEXT_132591 [Caerostris extrusa]|uniref:Uncharacterized protein n=1 Tax=Caerostris extrusa TaxID=172846 RepID=A0AAV4U8I5_CAEEX|nr:hypothetical protein CEXT_132591 [Caerostris extrusa]
MLSFRGLLLAEGSSVFPVKANCSCNDQSNEKSRLGVRQGYFLSFRALARKDALIIHLETKRGKSRSSSPSHIHPVRSLNPISSWKPLRSISSLVSPSDCKSFAALCGMSGEPHRVQGSTGGDLPFRDCCRDTGVRGLHVPI